MAAALADDLDHLRLSEDYIKFIDTEKELVDAIHDLSRHSIVSFDAEGVDLGRTGPLTVATFSGPENEDPIYVVDVHSLHGARVFSDDGRPSLRALLEDQDIIKVPSRRHHRSD